MTPYSDNRITYFAAANHRGKLRPFGIKGKDRRSHFWEIGKTGVGKSTLLTTMAIQDMEAGAGLTLLEPHGDLAESLKDRVPACREDDLTYIDAPDPNCRWHINPLADVAKSRQALAVAGLLDVFKKIWTDDWGPRLEHIFRYVLITLVATPEATLGDVPRLLLNKDYRREIVWRLEDEEVKQFWRDEYAGYSPRFRAVVTAPILNKVGGFLADPLLRRILTGAKSSFRFRKLLDDGKVLIVNLSKGRMGEGPSSLLGSLLVAQISLAALSRADIPEGSRRDHYLYLDEFQNFSTLTLATMFSELRKYRLNLSVANQYLGQLDREVAEAVLGNVGTLVSFRLGGKDASTLAREFLPTFTPEDLVNLPNFQIYLRLMIDGQVSKPFSAKTHPSGG